MGGYPELASLMGKHPEYAIFRRYAVLNAQNLLYFRLRLKELEEKLRSYAQADDNSSHPLRTKYSRDWYILNDSISPMAADGEDSRQWETFLKNQKQVAGVYAILLQKEIARLEDPNERDLQKLRKMMKSSDQVGVYLEGLDSTSWSEPYVDDLLAIRVRETEDSITQWIEDYILRGLYYLRGAKAQDIEHAALGNVVFTPRRKVLRVTRTLSTLLASLLPVTSIVILHFMDTVTKRLGAIVGLTAAFSLALELFTQASTIDIFSASAAFAAVQVVYVGTVTMQ